jgi:hypothetical protein
MHSRPFFPGCSGAECNDHIYASAAPYTSLNLTMDGDQQKMKDKCSIECGLSACCAFWVYSKSNGTCFLKKDEGGDNKYIYDVKYWSGKRPGNSQRSCLLALRVRKQSSEQSCVVVNLGCSLLQPHLLVSG